MNNNRSDERAILAGCKGVFAPASYITIGSKAKPEDYTKKAPDHPRFGGKQLGVAWPKEGKTVDTYFEKEHKWVFNGCKFNDRLMYATQQTKPGKGFMTSDYHRSPPSCEAWFPRRNWYRDEYSLDWRTEQYREQLKMEDKYAKKALAILKAQNPEAAGEPADLETLEAREGQDKPYLFDLVFDSEALTRDGSSKVHRDTRNPTWHTKDRKGNLRTTSLLAHAHPDASCFGKPQFANKPLIRDTFYRKTNINFPDGCSAVDTGEA